MHDHHDEEEVAEEGNDWEKGDASMATKKGCPKVCFGSMGETIQPCSFQSSYISWVAKTEGL